jgi:hypothetical protein
MIDLHTHSTASDGTWPPTQIVQEAVRVGLTAVALTDHDTVGGLAEFTAAARGLPVIPVTGVEISCSWYSGTMHILGLFIDPCNPPLLELVETVQTSRARRNAQVLRRLEQLGMPLTDADFPAGFDRKTLGRPHFAQALVKRGFCRDFQDAFERFLAGGRPAYFRRHLPLPEQVIPVLQAAGAVTVWAHPLAQLRESQAKLRQTARVLKGFGLDAIEALYPEFTAPEAQMVAEVAAQVGLLPSGGSDFHGANFAGVALGSGTGSLAVPDAFLAPLQALARQRAKTPPAKVEGEAIR